MVRGFKRVMKPLATSQEVLEDDAESDDDVIEYELNLCTRPSTGTPSNWDPETGFEIVSPGFVVISSHCRPWAICRLYW
jgi:hypothetical protein